MFTSLATKILTCFCVILVLINQATFAQEPDESARIEAEKMLEVMNMEELLGQSIEQFFQFQIQQDPTFMPYKNVMVKFLEKHMGYESLKDDLILIYSRAFTAQELKDINAFYSTPTGQKTLERAPELMQQGAQLGMQRVQENSAELEALIEAETKRLEAEHHDSHHE